MNYSYEGKDGNYIIKNYIKYNDKIVINLLNGYNYIIPFNNENEHKLIEKMLEQATERDKFYDDAIQNKVKSIKTTSIYLFSALANGAFYSIDNLLNIEFAKNIALSFTFVSCLFSVLSGSFTRHHINKANELTKYHIYLEIREKLENEKKVDLFYNVKKRDLNINTLDSFKLKELKQLKQNILNLDNGKNHVLNKRIN